MQQERKQTNGCELMKQVKTSLVLDGEEPEKTGRVAERTKVMRYKTDMETTGTK